jgi:hypothetical protein
MKARIQENIWVAIRQRACTHPILHPVTQPDQPQYVTASCMRKRLAQEF